MKVGGRQGGGRGSYGLQDCRWWRQIHTMEFDHYLIFLVTNPFERKTPKPFHFEQVWLTDPSFLASVESSWHASENIPYTSSSLAKFPRHLDFLTQQISVWNKTQFGNIFQRKNSLLARLRGLQTATSRNSSVFLYSLEQRLT